VGSARVTSLKYLVSWALDVFGTDKRDERGLDADSEDAVGFAGAAAADDVENG
jgi:hypothetical protein